MCISGQHTRRLHPTQQKPIIAYRTWTLVDRQLRPSYNVGGGAFATWVSSPACADVRVPSLDRFSDKGLHAFAKKYAKKPSQRGANGKLVYGSVALFGPTTMHALARKGGEIVGYRAAKANVVRIYGVHGDTYERTTLLKQIATSLGARYIAPRKPA